MKDLSWCARHVWGERRRSMGHWGLMDLRGRPCMDPFLVRCKDGVIPRSGERAGVRRPVGVQGEVAPWGHEDGGVDLIFV